MVFLPPVETESVKTDEDLTNLVRRVQEMIMKELGIEKLAIPSAGNAAAESA